MTSTDTNTHALDNMSISEIVLAYPRTVFVFEKYNIDYCCGGKKKLGPVLNEYEIQSSEIRNELKSLVLTSAMHEENHVHESLTSLVDHILLKHHAYVKSNIPSIQEHLNKVAYKHGEAFPYMQQVAIIFETLSKDLLQHMMKEEIILFPRIKKLEADFSNGVIIDMVQALTAPVAVMEYEHEHAGKLMEEIRLLTDNYSVPANACTTFRLVLEELKHFEKDLHQHVHLENNILFPGAINLYNQLKVAF